MACTDGVLRPVSPKPGVETLVESRPGVVQAGVSYICRVQGPPRANPRHARDWLLSPTHSHNPKQLSYTQQQQTSNSSPFYCTLRKVVSLMI